MSSMHTLPSAQSGVVINSYGPLAEVLTLSTSLSIPTPTATQVLVRVSHASINPIDYKLVTGEFPWVTLTFPHRPGFDVSGWVVAVGGDVKRFTAGDCVYGDGFTRSGAFQQYCVVEEEELSLAPRNISLAEAAALPLAAETSLSTLEKVGVKAGDRVLVTGAAGGCGAYGVQLAKALGASHVVAVTSSRHFEYVKSIGADEVIDYTSTSVSDSGVRGIDVVYDTIGGYWEDSRKTMTATGKYITIAFWTPQPTALEQGTQKWLSHILTSSHITLDRITAMVEQGKLKTNIDKVFPFSQSGVVELYEYSKQGKTRGKAIINIAQDDDA